MDSSRRSFFRGRASRQPPPLRPPWALDELAFTAACTRCGECLRACPTALLQAGPGQFPVADFSRGYCNFCGECSRVCAPHAIAADTSAEPWSLRITIAPSCLTEQNVVCRTCGDVCETTAIRFAPRLGGVARPEVDPTRCTGCGECVAPCPSAAIALAPITTFAEVPT